MRDSNKRALIFAAAGLTVGHVIGATAGGTPKWWWIATTYVGLAAIVLVARWRGTI